MKRELKPRLDRLDNEYLNELTESFDHINYFNLLREYDSNWNKYVSNVFKEGAERAQKLIKHLEEARKIPEYKLHEHMTI